MQSTWCPLEAEPLQLDDGRISLSFADADIREVIDVVLGDALDLNYIVNPSGS